MADIFVLVYFLTFMSITPEIFVFEISYFTHMWVNVLYICIVIILAVFEVFVIWYPYVFSIDHGYTNNC